QKIDALSVLRELCKTIGVVPFSKDVLYYPVEKYKDTEDGLLYFLASKAKMNYWLMKFGKSILICPVFKIICCYNHRYICNFVFFKDIFKEIN
ncbi:MAG: hypothetical protein ABIO81_11740, partial [Ginsengibacter sp.]